MLGEIKEVCLKCMFKGFHRFSHSVKTDTIKKKKTSSTSMGTNFIVVLGAMFYQLA